MSAKKPVLPATLGSDLARVDAHEPAPQEYADLPELTDAMLTHWRAAGPGWQTRMADRLVKGPAPRARTHD